MTPIDDDESNRTILRPISGGSDGSRTVMMPDPGRRRSRGGAQPSAQPTEPVAAPYVEPMRLASSGNCGNPILTAAATLLTVLTTVRNSLDAPDPNQLQRELAREIQAFDSTLQRSGVRNESALTARYILCTALDEAIANTPWGFAGGWQQRSLLSMFHNERHGGEKFFVMLETVQARSAEFRDLLGLFYVLLSVGFQGRHAPAIDPRGRETLEALRESVYRTLYGARRDDPPLATNWTSDLAGGNRLVRFVPLWTVAAIALTLAVVTYAGLRAWLHSDSADAVATLNAVYPQQKAE